MALVFFALLWTWSPPPCNDVRFIEVVLGCVAPFPAWILAVAVLSGIMSAAAVVLVTRSQERSRPE